MYRRSRLPVSETGTHEKNIIVMPRPGAAWPGRAFLDGDKRIHLFGAGDASQLAYTGKFGRDSSLYQKYRPHRYKQPVAQIKRKMHPGYGKADRFAVAFFRSGL